MKHLLIFMLLFLGTFCQAQDFTEYSSELISPKGDTSVSHFDTDLKIRIEPQIMQLCFYEFGNVTPFLIDEILMVDNATIYICGRDQIELREGEAVWYRSYVADNGIVRIKNIYK